MNYKIIVEKNFKLTHVQIINVRMELLHKQMVIHVHALAHHFTLEAIVRLT